jgi:shikimate kinase
MNKNNNIFLIGPSGSGKSIIGKCLAKELHYKFFDCIEEIEKCAGVNKDWIKDIEGEIGLLKREEKIITELTRLDHIILATTENVVLSLKNRELLKNNGIIVFLHDLQDKSLTLYQPIADITIEKTDQPVEKIAMKILYRIGDK